MSELTEDIIRRMPKVVIHDHLDGGLRPATIIELARGLNVDLPTNDPAALKTWFERGADKGSLAEYLEGFAFTCGVMQTDDGLERVAFEALEDLHEDGVAYAELRFAPQFHCERGLHAEAVVDAVLRGMERAQATRVFEVFVDSRARFPRVGTPAVCDVTPANELACGGVQRGVLLRASFLPLR